MPSFNKVIIAGHLCKDPELRDVGSTQVASMRLAMNESYTNKAGEKVEKAVFVDVDAWDKTAGLCAQYLKRGSAALIEGRLQMDEWEDKETGHKRSRLKVRAERVQFLGGKGQQDEPAPQPPAEPSAPAKSDDEIPF